MFPSSPRKLDVLSEPICIIGSGATGLITAQTLLRDGFEDVTIISRDAFVGGVWAEDRVYPGLQINHVHGEYRFSALDMAKPDSSAAGGGYITGEMMCRYMKTFFERFVEGKATVRLRTIVKSVRRVKEPTSESSAVWNVDVEDVGKGGGGETLVFSRVVLATGYCDGVNIPKSIDPREARKVGFQGLVFHSAEFGHKYDEAIRVAGQQTEKADEDRGGVVVVGGGKSAQDIAGQLRKAGCKVTMVCKTMDAFSTSKTPQPVWLRRSRFMSTLMPHHTLRTRTERFFQKTKLGSKIVHFVVNGVINLSLKAYNIPQDSPLRLTEPLFWSIAVGDAGLVKNDSFQALVRDGDIKVVAPARVSGYSDDGKGVVLSDGSVLPAAVVVLATGYKSSWPDILSEDMLEELGMDKHAPTVEIVDKWNYESMKGGDTLRPEDKTWTTSIYRGLVPAKNIFNRDFAIAGGFFTSNFGYSNEVAANWISAYFMGDKMRLPATVEQAIVEAEERAAWVKLRYPGLLRKNRDMSSTTADAWTWPQAADELLEDMYLRSRRSGGHGVFRLFKVIESSELATLGEEREALRESKQ